MTTMVVILAHHGVLVKVNEIHTKYIYKLQKQCKYGTRGFLVT
jgi:hypothetical protein